MCNSKTAPVSAFPCNADPVRFRGRLCNTPEMVRIELTEDQYALLVHALGYACGAASKENLPFAEGVFALGQHIMGTKKED